MQLDSTLLGPILSWREWDIDAIVSTVVGGLLLALLLWITGVARKVIMWIRRIRGEHRFDKATRAVCDRVIVVGRREGFRLDDVYVPLDLAPSDIAGVVEPQDDRRLRKRAFVLLGGPGAGKSTWVKHYILNWPLGRAFLVRLRDLPADYGVVDFIARDATRAGIPEAVKWVQTQLSRRSLVVLDGLDEVRAADWDRVCERINDFFRVQVLGERGPQLIVTCRKEAFRTIPLIIPDIREVRPLTDQQIARFAAKWPLGYPAGKSDETFLRDLRGSERVLALARSPLMLVGALMQYTESNLGIPDERKDYLERIARWLLEDWAKAQGHPADEWRKAYAPVLSRLAFEMHAQQVAEIPRAQGARIIREMLPKVGLDGGKTDQFIEKLVTKTGLLLRDTPGALVFAQLSLQEFFAASHVAVNLNPGELTALPMPWWREPIILAVAQQSKPDAFFNALFERDPVLAVAAVAEHPTPPLVFQGRAVDAALEAMERGGRGIGDAIIILSRKVEGRHERNLISKLEERLDHAEPVIAADAGRVLALSGTAAANEALGRNPKSWERNLAKVGYFSTSFENLLVAWLRSDEAERAEAAASALLGRLSDDRREELIGMLEDLPRERAARVANGLIQRLEEYRLPRWRVDDSMLRVACYCAPHLASHESPVGRAHDIFEHPAMTVTRVAAKLMTMGFKTPAATLKIMRHSEDWAAGRGAMLWALSSALVVLSIGLADDLRSIVLIASIALAFATCFLNNPMVPWFPVRFAGGRDLPLSFVSGGAGASLLVSGSYGLPLSSKPAAALVYALLLTLMAIPGGIHVPDAPPWRSGKATLPALEWALIGWTLLILVLLLVLHIWPGQARTATLVISIAGIAALVPLIALKWWSARRVLRARDAVFEGMGVA